MENYVIYDELNSDEQGVIYKGRRKGTIEFVAVHCVDKRYRAFVTNAVRLLHNLQHSNILKFLEWYETSNHLWIVSEILSGGSLAEIIAQDGHLPEMVVREFGVEICKGLFHLHQNSVLFARLSPDAIALDSNARPKLIDFQFARLIDEDLDVVFGLVSPKERDASVNDYDNNLSWRESFLANPQFSSPEVLDCENPGGPETMTMAADIWSLGVCLHQMLTGEVPFKGETAEEVLRQIYRGPSTKIGEISGKRGGAAASDEMIDLIKGLLRVDLRERWTWKEIVAHPFWGGKLETDLAGELEHLDNLRGSGGSDATIQNETDSLENTVKTVAEVVEGDFQDDDDDDDELNDANDDVRPNVQRGTNRRLSRPRREIPSIHEPSSIDDADDYESSLSTPKRRPIEGNDNLFGLSISHSSLPIVERKASPSPKRGREDSRRGLDDDDDDDANDDDYDDDDENEILFHPSDLIITHPYPDPPSKGGSLKFDGHSLPGVKFLPPAKAVNASRSSVDATFDNVEHLLSTLAAGDGQSKAIIAQKQLAILSYLGSLVHHNRGGDFILRSLVLGHSAVLMLLAHLVKSNAAEDSVRQRSAFVLSAISFVAFQNSKSSTSSSEKSKFPPKNLDCHKVLSILAEVVRDGTTPKPLRSQCLVSLLHVSRLWTIGFLQRSSSSSSSTPFPSLFLTVVLRGLRSEGSSSSKEEVRPVFTCVRIIHVLAFCLRRAQRRRLHEEGGSSSSKKETIDVLRSKLTSPELSQTLWTIVSRSPEMSLRCLAASTLIAIGRNEASTLYACVDRAGLPAVVGVLSGESNRRPSSTSSRDANKKIDSSTSLFLQLTSTILNLLLRHPPHAVKISQNKDALKHLLQSSENTNPLVRAKVVMAFHAMIEANRDAFIGCCKGRLISVLEREIKQMGPAWNAKGEEDRDGTTMRRWRTDSTAYLSTSLRQFVEFLQTLAHDILKDSCDALREVSGRKHPSANQSIRLKNSLPHLHPLHQAFSSATLRPVLLRDPLILHHLVGILNETPTIASRATNIDPALGAGQTEEVVKIVLSLFEVLAVSSKTFAPEENATSPAASLTHDRDESTAFENTPTFDLLIEGVLPPLVVMMTPSSSSTPYVLRLLTHLLSPAMVAPSPRLHAFVVDRLLPRLADVISGDGGGESVHSSNHSLTPSLGLSLLHILVTLSPHPLNVGEIPIETKIALANAARDVIEGHLNQKHLLTPTVNQALSIFATLLASTSLESCSSIAQFPPLWTTAHRDWKIITFLVGIVKTAEIDPDEVDGTDSSVTHQFIEALLALLQTVVQFVSDRIRFVVSSRKNGKSVDTAAAENLLLHHRPLIRAFSPLLHRLMTSTDFDLASTAIACLSLLSQLFGGEHHPPLTPRHLELYARALAGDAASTDVRKSAMGQHVRTILRTLKRLALVGGKDERKSKRTLQIIAVFREEEEVNEDRSLLSVLSRMCEVAASHADVASATMAREIIDSVHNV